jgi:hypothetical protein
MLVVVTNGCVVLTYFTIKLLITISYNTFQITLVKRYINNDKKPINGY